MAKNKSTSVYFDREKLCFVGLEDAHLKRLREIYKGIDVNSELKKMGLWLTSSKGIRRKGDIGFILNWLNNASPSNQFPSTNQNQDFIEYDSPLRPLLLDYLADLWKGKEQLLEFNTIKKTS